MRKEVDAVIIGGGPAGIAAATSLAEIGIRAVLVEASAEVGGKLNLWHHLFPDRMPSHELLKNLTESIKTSGIEIRTGSSVQKIVHDKAGWLVQAGDDAWLTRSVLVATGFDVFDARLKEEYGYGIYEHVITSVDLEKMFREGTLAHKTGKPLQRIAFVHCVGSRDEKVGNHHCSRACCITGVKQAIEVRELLPSCEVYNFYMDMRMFGSGYEELYREAQEQHNVTFIRGRVSEAAETRDGRIMVKAEDTLSGRPLKITVDLLVLLVGMVPAAITKGIREGLGATVSPDGFLQPEERFTGMNKGPHEGIFFAGTCTGPRSIPEAISDGRSAALEMAAYLKNEYNPVDA